MIDEDEEVGGVNQPEEEVKASQHRQGAGVTEMNKLEAAKRTTEEQGGKRNVEKGELGIRDVDMDSKCCWSRGCRVSQYGFQ